MDAFSRAKDHAGLVYERSEPHFENWRCGFIWISVNVSAVKFPKMGVSENDRRSPPPVVRFLKSPVSGCNVRRRHWSEISGRQTMRLNSRILHTYSIYGGAQGATVERAPTPPVMDTCRSPSVFRCVGGSDGNSRHMEAISFTGIQLSDGQGLQAPEPLKEYLPASPVIEGKGYRSSGPVARERVPQCSNHRGYRRLRTPSRVASPMAQPAPAFHIFRTDWQTPWVDGNALFANANDNPTKATAVFSQRDPSASSPSHACWNSDHLGPSAMQGPCDCR